MAHGEDGIMPKKHSNQHRSRSGMKLMGDMPVRELKDIVQLVPAVRQELKKSLN